MSGNNEVTGATQSHDIIPGNPPPYSQAWGSTPVTYGQPPSYGMATTITVIQPNAIPHPAGTFHFSSEPALVICQHCNTTVTTTTSYQTGLMTWISAGIICLVGCWAGCCLIPFCIDATKDAIHSCPNCSQVVGSLRQIN